MNNNLLTIKDICNELGVSKCTAYNLTRSGQIKSAKIGKRTVTTKESIEKYIDNKIFGSTKE